MERQVFPADDNRCQNSRKSYDSLSCGPNQSQDGYFKLYDHSSSSVRLSYRFVVIIYRGTSVLLCGVSLIFVEEPKFLLYV